MTKAKAGPTKPAKPTAAAKPPRASKEPALPEDPAATAPEEAAQGPKGKTQALIALMRRDEGACLEEMMAATGWQAHSVRGAISGAIKRKLGLAVCSQVREGVRVYRIAAAQA